jgi:hypothetical protein
VRELRALGLTDDGKSLVLVDLSRGAEGERFRVAADERLRAALRSGAPRAAVQAETRVESALSPREIQSRLRAGVTAEEVAKAAGIPVGRVQRYETPILAERARVVSEARSASAPGPHRNTPGRPLGGLVDDRVQQEGLDPEAVEWDAKRRQDGTWLVTLAMEAGGAARATWSWDPSARRVRAIDAGATAILAPMPAPTAGPDSLTAIAEATGVAERPAQEADHQAMAVGDDAGRRRAPAASRAGGRSSGLVVLTGRGDEDETARPRQPEPTSARQSVEADVPGGSSAPLPAAAAVTPTSAAAGVDEVLLPGTEPRRRPASSDAQSQPALDGTDPVADEVLAPAAAAKSARPTAGRRRSAVPAWDDIMFGARRG